MDTLPGFREFYPDACATRNHLFRVFRQVAARFGFLEYDAPILEPLDLFTKKSGPEIIGQLYNFEDKGGRQVALRPEMTPTLAKLVGSKASSLKKPIKWFHIGEHFRYERPQKGRLRSFFQFNADILGEEGPAADAELIAFLVESLKAYGLNQQDFIVRLSDRELWMAYLSSIGIEEGKRLDVLGVVDKSERESAEKSLASLGKILGDTAQTVWDQIQKFMAINSYEELNDFFSGSEDEGIQSRLKEWSQLSDFLSAFDVDSYIKVDFAIVRGLAYYTGFVFEVFGTKGKHRALAGGGRYNDLVKKLCGGEGMAAVGFGMGEVTVGDYLKELNLSPSYVSKPDVYVVIGGDEERKVAYQDISLLRQSGLSVDYPMKTPGFGKQFKEAGQKGAPFALIYGGNELADGIVKIRDLSARDEIAVPKEEVVQAVHYCIEQGGLPQPEKSCGNNECGCKH